VEYNLDVYNRFSAEYTEFHLYPPEREVMGRLRNELPRMKMLDIGIGTGRTTNTFAALCDSYVGIDYAEEMLERCNSNFPKSPRVSLRHLDARNLSSLEDAPFDFVMFSMNGIDSLDHHGREKVLSEVRKVISPTGYFLFSTHSISAFTTARPLPTFNWASPLRSVWRLVRGLVFNIRLARANGGRSEQDIRIRDWDILKTGDHDFEIDIYHIQPHVQLKELKRLGFDVISILDHRGHEVDAQASMSPWLYYFCRPASGHLAIT
jgi:SAM-dependent methyltransferase